MSQKTSIFIGGIAHLGNGEKIENSIISIKDGKFDLISESNNTILDLNEFDTVIRIDGKHIYPAFISPNTTLGITEIDRVRASHDYNEVGQFNPNVRSLIAFNTDSRILATVRTNGVLISQTTPRGGYISGSSSIMHLDGWNWEDAVLKADDGIHINWPSYYISYGWRHNQDGEIKNNSYDTSLTNIKSYFEKAKSYYENSKEIDLEFNATRSLFTGEKNLYIHVNHAKDIRESITYFNNIGIKKIVIIGGKDALNAIEILKKENIPIILERIHSLPSNEDAAIDELYTLPAKLEKEGILFALSYQGDMEAMGSRNLPFTAGTAVAYGLEAEKAISAITLNTAIILGIEKTSGSIEKGKHASFFISSGDALDIRTNQLESAYIKGKKVNLENHQKELFEKFKNH